MAPPFDPTPLHGDQRGLSEGTLKTFQENGIPFWGFEKPDACACVITADVCYDHIDGWGPIVCIGHGTISKNIYFIDGPIARRENFATVLCVPGPWYTTCFGSQVFTKIAPTGFSKLDELADFNIADIPRIKHHIGFDPGKKTILFAPTFNLEFTGLVMLAAEWARLDPAKYQVIFKLHGATHYQLLDHYRQLAATQSNFYYVESPSIVPWMHVCDIMISDVSSVFLEFLVLDKPVILVNNPEMTSTSGYNPDAVEFKFRDAAYQINGAEELAPTLSEIALSDPLSEKRRAYAARIFPPMDGKNSQRIAEEVMKVVSGETVQRFPEETVSLNVYIPKHVRNRNLALRNLDRALAQCRVYTHSASFPDSFRGHLTRLAEDELPPQPFISITGEYLFPFHWDFLWSLSNHFSPIRGISGPLLEDSPESGAQNIRIYIQDSPAGTPRELQPLYKYILFDKVLPASSLKPDGLVFSKNVSLDAVRYWLEAGMKDETGFADFCQRQYIPMELLPGFFCFSSYSSSDSAVPPIAEPSRQTAVPLAAGDAEIFIPAADRSYILSALVSTYKSGKFIRGCLDDLENQTIASQIEIIVINSGSPEHEEPIVLDFQRRYSNITYIKTKREPLYAAWNRGIKVARGKYITSANTDDRHRKDGLEVMVRALENDPGKAIAYGNSIITNLPNAAFETAPVLRRHEWVSFDHVNNIRKCEVGPQPVWRRSLHDEFGYFDEKYKVAGDYEFWLRVGEKYEMVHIPEDLGAYLTYDNNLEHQNMEGTYLESVEVSWKYLTRHLERNSLSPARIDAQIGVHQQALNRFLAEIKSTGTLTQYNQFEYHFYSLTLLAFMRGDTLQARNLCQTFFQIAHQSKYMASLFRFLLTKNVPLTASLAEQPLVSFIIPLYNQAPYLAETVASIAGQNYRNWEAVIVNDGSTDNSLEIALALKEKYAGLSITVLSQNNQGKAVTRNRGVQSSHGKYICILDSDDQVATTYLETSLKMFEQNPQAGWVTPWTLQFGPAVNQLMYNFKQDFITMLTVCLSPVSALFKREMYDEVNGFSSMSTREDWEFWIKAGEHGWQGLTTPTVEFMYRMKVERIDHAPEINLKSKRELYALHPWWFKVLPESERDGVFNSCPTCNLPAEFLNPDSVTRFNQSPKPSRKEIRSVVETIQKEFFFSYPDIEIPKTALFNH